jgi:hypothetical protein
MTSFVFYNGDIVSTKILGTTFVMRLANRVTVKIMTQSIGEELEMKFCRTLFFKQLNAIVLGAMLKSMVINLASTWPQPVDDRCLFDTNKWH